MANGKRNRRPTDAAIIKAIRESRGNVSVAAEALGVLRCSLHNRIADTPGMRQVVIDARESLVDHAETALAAAVERGEGWAVCFTLKCLGKARGYIERQEVVNSGTVSVIDWTAIMSGVLADERAAMTVQEPMQIADGFHVNGNGHANGHTNGYMNGHGE